MALGYQLRQDPGLDGAHHADARVVHVVGLLFRLPVHGGDPAAVLREPELAVGALALVLVEAREETGEFVAGEHQAPRVLGHPHVQGLHGGVADPYARLCGLLRLRGHALFLLASLGRLRLPPLVLLLPRF